MIRVRGKNVNRSVRKSQITIDLISCASRNEIISRIAKSLHTEHSNTVDGSSLDYFVDVLSDWMRESLPKPSPVQIINAAVASQYEEGLLAKLVACMHQAMMMALRQRSRDERDFDLDKESRALIIDFYL